MDARHPARLKAPARGLLREERHPNSVTAPPVLRGSMPPRPWAGFWKGLGSAALSLANRLIPPREPRAPRATPAPWECAALRRRRTFLALTVGTSLLAAFLFAQVQPDAGPVWVQVLHAVLFVLLTTWVATGFVTALMGAWVLLRGDPHSVSAASVRGRELSGQTRTAVIMPICNEDVATVFAGLRATCESLAGTGYARQFDVFVLSDSKDRQTIAAERQAWEALRAALATPAGDPAVQVYYRLRQRRTHRKAGNVADFCRRWGRHYDHMVVLDADSVMSGASLVTLAKLMEAHPQAGIIQTATQSIGHQTLHARTQQFAARVTGRLFTLGMQFWQLGESHYWGHNAIIRVDAFMRHCALAPIEGRGGLSGGILSHDFVEAALMRRAGYHVWLVADVGGSFEQQPPDLLSELQRDRRWCQGNLQNARLIAEPGLHRMHRAMLAVGAMSYLSAPLWLGFMVLGLVMLLSTGLGVADVRPLSGASLGLWAVTLTLLFLPRVLGVAAVLLKGQQRGFGGTWRLLGSALLESVLALLQAPVRMVAHSIFVWAALTGMKLDWKSPPREATGVAWRTATGQLGAMQMAALILMGALAMTHPTLLPWLLPVILPLALASITTVLTGHVRLGAWFRSVGALLVPEEAWSPAVLRKAWRHAARMSVHRAAAPAG
ncbi:MAG TPA: glucans biosynthesis glucosyltransferase MdoH [Hydrogenophaga sp.]|uniref:glucans biosynthesis glucosyltransferase MdoH n=1 Tax=Hydrogenophaga sp. TaxID=1904254 RepID=UPI002BB29357|nr:glucans biosynthesis glucosyltransferase MdoH [Hydrogenophaga sp.]HMN94512.1 glucans biosynthesis glucosyltransferase MdoH [Hydrogenophaga sp.]HMP11295.1 glucans biosynthesis glucosyltransferase MdoH [Hydrogenophaga sp.]